MGGRFGKYGDLKRRQALRRSRREKIRLGDQTPGRQRWTGQRQPNDPAAAKTVRTAVVMIPPEVCWAPIQALRQYYDRHYRRWMPHITLLYPYRPITAFKTAVPQIARACRPLTPFDVRLARFDFFTHERSATIYLAAEPAATIRNLHQALQAAAPDCDDTARFSSGFTPHLSVAQAPRREAEKLSAQWQSDWQPMVFTVTHIHVVWRNKPPDDVFRTGPAIALGKSEA